MAANTQVDSDVPNTSNVHNLSDKEMCTELLTAYFDDDTDKFKQLLEMKYRTSYREEGKDYTLVIIMLYDIMATDVDDEINDEMLFEKFYKYVEILLDHGYPIENDYETDIRYHRRKQHFSSVKTNGEFMMIKSLWNRGRINTKYHRDFLKTMIENYYNDYTFEAIKFLVENGPRQNYGTYQVLSFVNRPTPSHVIVYLIEKGFTYDNERGYQLFYEPMQDYRKSLELVKVLANYKGSDPLAKTILDYV